MKTHQIARAAIIAAIYAAITLFPPIAAISYGPVQVRIAEALTILPFIMPEAILGLFVGCLIANLFSPVGWMDIVFGSLATLLAAFLSSKMPHKYLAPLPPVLVNAVVVGFLLNYQLGWPLLPTMLQVGAGQFVACYVLGLLLLFFLHKLDWPK